MLAYACAVAAASPLANRYIDLIENAVTGSLHDEAGRCIMGGDHYTWHHLACEPCATRIMDTTRTCPHHDCAKPILMFMRLFPGGYVSPKTPSPDESADDASPHVSTAASMRSAEGSGSSSGSDVDGSPEQSRRATPTAELSPPPPPSARAPGH